MSILCPASLIVNGMVPYLWGKRVEFTESVQNMLLVQNFIKINL